MKKLKFNQKSRTRGKEIYHICTRNQENVLSAKATRLAVTLPTEDVTLFECALLVTFKLDYSNVLDMVGQLLKLVLRFLSIENMATSLERIIG